jgi:TolA-binding protein
MMQRFAALFTVFLCLPLVSAGANTVTGSESGPISSEILKRDNTPQNIAPTIRGSERLIRPRSHLEVEALMMEYQTSLRSFERTALAIRDEIRNEIRRSVEQRIRYIAKLYEGQISEARGEETKLRADAIKHFEYFVKTYDDHPKHTPDALFRLAELYYEDADHKFFAAMDSFDKNLDLYNRGKIADEPESPRRDYSGVIHSLSRLVEAFPDYRFADSAYYLLGYTLIESGEEEEGKKAYLTLVERFPQSNFAPECLLRLGELEFDMANFEEAIKFYQRVLAYPKSSFYDLAMYKLAWSYNQQAEYPKAIEIFKKLIAHYDAQDAEGGKGHSGQLRIESIKNIARRLADSDWDGDGKNDPESGNSRAFSFLDHKIPIEREVLAAYAVELVERAETDTYTLAVDVYKQLIAGNIIDPENPIYQMKVIELYDILRDTENQANAREELAMMFAKNSAWYQANQENAKALRRVRKMVELALFQRAKVLHVGAQNLKAEGIAQQNLETLRRSAERYLAAADAYKTYVESYPNAKNAYEARYNGADALYYAAEFYQNSESEADRRKAIAIYLKAVGVYGFILDTQGRVELREKSGHLAIVSAQQAIVSAISLGDLPAKANPDSSNDVIKVQSPDLDASGPSTVKAEPLPQLVLTWVDVCNRYIEAELHRPDDLETGVKHRYLIASMYYRFYDFEQARKIAADIIENKTNSSVATNAADIIINSLKIENDWDNLKIWLAKIVEKELGSPEEAGNIREQLRLHSLGADFKSALTLLDQGKTLEAALEFERLAEQPGFKLAEDALFNAAIGYAQVKHYEKATRAFEKILNNPDFKNETLKEKALLEVGNNSRKFFDFDKAIASFLGLYKRNPVNENSPAALFEAAQLLENDGRHENAGRWFEEYESAFSARDDATNSLYRAASAWRKASETSQTERGQRSAQKEEIRLLKRFINRARSKMEDKDGVLVLKSLVRLGELELAKGRENQARRYFQDTLTFFQQRSYGPNSPEAYFAAQAQFMLLEQDFADFKTIALKGSMKQQMRVMESVVEERDGLLLAYRSIYSFKVNTWTYASLFREGQIYQEFAQKFYDAPMPSGLGQEDLDFYQMTIQDEGAKWEDIAVARFEAMVKRAREEKITNEWLKQAIVMLNGYNPSKYPLPKKERATFVWEDSWSAQMRGYKADPNATPAQENKPEAGPLTQPTPPPSSPGATE